MNSFLKEIIKYRDKASKRRENRVFLVEGIKMALEVPEDRLKQLVFSKSFYERYQTECRILSARVLEKDIHVISDEEFLKISDTKTPQGVLCVVEFVDQELETVLSSKKGMYVFLENLQDPGNLGTILRSSEASGVAGIILSGSCVDLYNPKVVRSSMGAIFRVPCCIVSDFSEALELFHKTGGKSYAAHLGATLDYMEPDYTEKCGFLIGNESKGLTEEISDQASQKIKIPMEGAVESLNAAMATTILTFEAYRQRRK